MSSLDQPLVSSDQRSDKTKKGRASGETGTLCRESSSNVSILISVPILILIGQNDGKLNYLSHRHHIRTLARLQDERMNCDLANACGEVLPLISNELEGTFPAKCKGQRRSWRLGVEFQSLSDYCTVDPEGLCILLLCCFCHDFV